MEFDAIDASSQSALYPEGNQNLGRNNVRLTRFSQEYLRFGHCNLLIVSRYSRFSRI